MKRRGAIGGMLVLAMLLAAFGAPCLGQESAAKFEFKQGDHVTLIGNLLAERMQHDGWLEAILQSRLPQQQLVFRNIGFSGDEITNRLRSAGFGSPDEWLTQLKTDVVLAFFGYNESFAGEAGLEKFKQDVAGLIQSTKNQKYNGQSAPRLVLCSPIAFENLNSSNLPDGVEHNRRLEIYTKAMAEVAAAGGATFVDLFHPMLKRYEASAEPLTLNGHFLNSAGNRAVAEIIAAALLPDAAAAKPLDEAALEKTRQAVIDKDFYWFHRYRTTDGYNVYGGRSYLKFTDDISNRDSMQREMEILDALAALRDKRVWAVASGGDLQVDDSQTPPFINVKTNKPGPLEGGKHIFLTGEDAISKMTVAEGMKVELVASEEKFPELINPVQMAFDPKGRLWVATWPTYPHWTPKEPMDDRLLILEDTNGDGRTDKVKTFAGGLHNPTGFEFWGGGVIVSMAPDLIFLKDTDGDDVADVRTRVLHGIDSADTHHTANSFVIDPGGALYFQEGVFHQSQVETLHEGSLRNHNACVWRFEPRTFKVDRYIPHGFANPHGHVFDRWGQDFVHDGTGATPYHAPLFSGYLPSPQTHPSPPVLYDRKTRPCPATEILSSKHFPEANQGNLLVANVIGFQGILQYKFEDRDSSFGATEVEAIVSSSDPNFRPVDLEIGSDGALYFVDWQNPIIGHMQHHIRDPNRDKTHGRVYRVIMPGRPLLKSPDIAGEPIERLLDNLKDSNDRVRYRTRLELSGRPTDEVLAEANQWLAKQDAADPEYQHHVLEVLWLHQQHNVVNTALLERVLHSPDYRARAAATRVVGYWRDRVSNALDLLKVAAADPHPRVRLEAVRAASFFKQAEAVEVPLIATDHPTDKYIDFVRTETMKALDPYWKAAIAEGRQVAVTSEAGMRYLLANISTPELLKMKRDKGVYVELLFRDGVPDDIRRDALAGYARSQSKPELRVLLDTLKKLDERQPEPAVVYALVRLLTDRGSDELAGVREELLKMATDAQLPTLRQIGYIALISADGKADSAWQTGSASVNRLRDFVAAVRLIPDPSIRASLYPKIEPLLHGLPEPLATRGSKSKGTDGRYVRIELPGDRKTLTLAEVEVMSDGRNVARQGKASQKATAHGGDAQRGIDGNTNGSYGGGGQTHTPEDQPNPWWEVDLGTEMPIDSITIHNRTDDGLGKRLDNFTLKVLDASRNEVFSKDKNPAPKQKATFMIGGGGSEGLIRRAAMTAVTSIRGHEAETFKTLAGFIKDGTDRASAIRAIQRIPQQFWPKEEAQPLVASLVVYVGKIPAAERTGPNAVEALQFGDALAALLPADAAKAARGQLGELGVRVLRLGTLPHRMAYDQERLAVRAGKPVEIIFENTDIMPHNFAIVQPGSLEEIGLLAETTAQQPDAIARNYIPKSDKIMLASKLLQPNESDRLSLTAPAKPGIYPYVCTYPGHWRRMFGALYVVEDLDGFLAAPEEYLAAHPLPIADDLLKFNRPRTEWKFEDLVEDVEELKAGRSFMTAKQIFQAANCVGCHKLNGAGFEIGPDLTKLDPKWKQLDILGEVLDPSKRINEKYQSYTLLLNSGRVVTGLILEETADTVKLIENPLAKNEPLLVKKADIEERQKSAVSLMPKGLLDKLTREEILDLIAYITARGDQNHELFKGGHPH